jgi:hypothetical protein
MRSREQYKKAGCVKRVKREKEARNNCAHFVLHKPVISWMA